MSRSLTVASESWPIAGGFTISRGSKSAAEVVVVELREGEHTGRGECVPYGRYGESVESVCARIDEARAVVEEGAERRELPAIMPAGSARNAIDAALWDLDAKSAGRRAWELAGVVEPAPAVCAYTLSLADPEVMGAEAAANAHRPLLKLKLGGEGDVERVAAVRAGAPEALIIVDANEAWSPDTYRRTAPRLAEMGVAMIEQPFPEGEDEALADLDRPVPVCADESIHDVDSLEAVHGRYDMVNIKLDKTGGLTEALRLHSAALEAGLSLMVGCMVATSLAMAPATLLTVEATFVDLDGPLLLEHDRIPGLAYVDGWVSPPEPELWG